jgi:putative oxidoreductase
VSVGLLIVRLVVGLTLAAHGCQKLFGWFGGGGVRGTGLLMDSLGFRPGRLHASLAGLTELAGGLLLGIGLLTPLAAASVVGVMVVAAVSVHVKGGFFLQKGGFEYTLVLGGVALAVAFTGPGSLSLDHGLGVSRSGDLWGLFALVLGTLGASIQLLARRKTAPAAEIGRA